MSRLLWAFHGPRSAGIGNHHAVHLREFAEREGISAQVSVESEANTTTVVMTVSDDQAADVAAALKPNRVEP